MTTPTRLSSAFAKPHPALVCFLTAGDGDTAANLDALVEGGADVILDMVGGDYVQKNLNCLNRFGRIVMIAFLKGSRVEVDLMGLMLKRQTLTGSTLRPQSVAAKAGIAASLRERVWPMFASGALAPVIHATFQLEEASAAHVLMETSTHIGKIILEIS